MSAAGRFAWAAWADEVQARLDAEDEWAGTPEGSFGSCLHRGACERAMRRFVGASDHVTPDPPRWLGCEGCDEWEGERWRG